jgi:hypothetical protein
MKKMLPAEAAIKSRESNVTSIDHITLEISFPSIEGL